MATEAFSRVQIGRLVTKVATWNPRVSESNGTIRYVDISSVDREMNAISGVAEMAAHDAPSRARQLVRTGDVLVSTVRPNLNAVACVGADLDGATASTGYCVLRADPAVLDFRYLLHWVRSGRFVREMTRKATGASYPAVTDRIVKDSRIPLPYPEDQSRSLEAQNRIAAILDQADAIRRKRREAIEVATTIIPAVFHQMFGDAYHNPKTWDVVRFKDIIADGPQNGLYRPASDYGSGTPILRIDSFYDGEVCGLDSLKRVRIDDRAHRNYLLREGDIVINRVNSREYLGKSAIIRGLVEPTVFESNMMRLGVDPRRADPQFVVTMLQQRHIRRQVLRRCKDAVNQSSINQADVESFEFPLPPLTRQRAFASAYLKAWAVRSRMVESLGMYDELLASLLQRAFKGEL